jgi:hypothetical protein
MCKSGGENLGDLSFLSVIGSYKVFILFLFFLKLYKVFIRKREWLMGIDWA